MHEFVGIYLALYTLPPFIVFTILVCLTYGVIHTLRDRSEGLGYWVSYSAMFGIPIIIGAVLVAQGILQRGGEVPLPWLFNNGEVQLVVLLGALTLGFAIHHKTVGKRSSQWADTYNDAVLAPLNLFLGITLIPIIVTGTWYEILAVVLAAVIYGVLIRLDIKEKRLNQRRWLIDHGFAIKGVIPEE